MKKFLTLFLCFNFLCAPAYCTITDDFAEKTLDKKLEIKRKKETAITDDFAEKSLNKELRIRKKKELFLSDIFAEKNPNKNTILKIEVNYDEKIPSVKNNKTNKKIVIIDESNMKAVKVSIKKYFTTKGKVDEGDYIEFETLNDITLNNKKYPAGSTVTARVETLSMNNSMGVPADLVIGNFSIDGIFLAGEISKTGANRTFWVYPCVYGLWWFFGLGLLFIPVRGGHAKILKSQIYTLYAN